MVKALYLIFFLLSVCSCQSKRTIVNDVDESDANEILVLLDLKGIQGYKTEEKAAGPSTGPKEMLWDISVPSGDAESALSLLAQNGLPRTKSPNLLQLFTNTGLVPSNTAETIRYRQGLADEIANMIRQIDGVVDAEVQLSFPEEDALNPSAKLPPITASVFVKHTGILDNPNEHLISKIKQLVSGAIAGLSYDNVTVIPSRARFAIPTSTVIDIGSKEYIDVFGFSVDKNSAGLFRAFMIFVCAFPVILFLFTAWLFWKIYPILKKRGGLGMLFHLTPFPDNSSEPKQ